MTARRIGVVAKRGLTAAAPHLVEVARWLIERDVAVRMDPETASIAGLADVPTSERADLPRHVDLVLVLGGDGTLLGMADAVGAAGTGIPILGVNFGRLGFLTEVTLDELFPALEVVLSGNAQVSERAMVRAKTLAGGAVVDPNRSSSFFPAAEALPVCASHVPVLTPFAPVGCLEYNPSPPAC